MSIQSFRISFQLGMAAAMMPFLTAIGLAAEPSIVTSNSGPSAATSLANLFADTVVAKGKGFEIKRSTLDDEVIRRMAQIAASGRQIGPQQKMLLQQDTLNNLIGLQLLQGRVVESDRTNAYAKVDKQFEEMRKKLGTEENLNRQLKSWGATREQVIEQWRTLALAEAVLDRELAVTITPEEVKKAYEEHRSDFEQPELVRVSHILFATRDLTTREELSFSEKEAKVNKAEEVLKHARAGEDFAALVKEYSDDTGTKDKGGEYVFGREMIPDKQFEAAVFALETNKVSDIVTTQLGYHIIKVLGRFPSRVAGLDDEVAISPLRFVIVKKDWPAPIDSSWEVDKVSNIIRRNLETAKRQSKLPEFMTNLRKQAGVEILDESLKFKEPGTNDVSRPMMAPPAPAAGRR